MDVRDQRTLLGIGTAQLDAGPIRPFPIEARGRSREAALAPASDLRGPVGELAPLQSEVEARREPVLPPRIEEEGAPPLTRTDSLGEESGDRESHEIHRVVEPLLDDRIDSRLDQPGLDGQRSKDSFHAPDHIDALGEDFAQFAASEPLGLRPKPTRNRRIVLVVVLTMILVLVAGWALSLRKAPEPPPPKIPVVEAPPLVEAPAASEPPPAEQEAALPRNAIGSGPLLSQPQPAADEPALAPPPPRRRPSAVKLSRAVEQAKATKKPSEHPPSAGFPEEE